MRRVPVVLALAVGVAACRRAGLPPRPDGAAVVVTTETSDDGVATGAEVEPNDTLPAAQRVAVTEATAAAVAGTLAMHGPKRDVDLFRIDLPATDAGAVAAADAGAPPPRLVLRADLRPAAGLAVSLDALDEAGRTVLAIAGQPGEAIAIPNLAVRSGAVLLRVRAAGGEPPAAATYRLAVRLAPFDTGAEIEPNGDAPHATELALGGEAVGYLGWHRDQDWYRLSTAGLAEGSVLSADLDPVAEVSTALQLIGTDGHKISEARGRKGERVTLRNLRLAPGDGPVWLVVRAEAGWSGTARYNLRPRTELAKAGTEAEPNDDVAHAQPIEDGTALGYLPRGDVDVYRYTTPGMALLDLDVTPPSRATVQVEVLREDGTLLARAESSRHGPAHLAGTSIPGGPIFLRVSPRKASGNADEPYRLTISSRPPDGT